MLPTLLRPLLVGTLSLQACTSPSAGSGGLAARARGSLAWAAKGYAVRQAGPTALRPFAREHLVRVELYLQDEADPTQPLTLLGVVSPGAFDRPLWIDNLVPRRAYTIQAKAYQPLDATAEDNLVEAQITGSSTTRFRAGEPGSTVNLDDAGGIRLVLQNRDFIASAQGSMAVRPGALDDTAASEALAQEAP